MRKMLLALALISSSAFAYEPYHGGTSGIRLTGRDLANVKIGPAIPFMNYYANDHINSIDSLGVAFRYKDYSFAWAGYYYAGWSSERGFRDYFYSKTAFLYHFKDEDVALGFAVDQVKPYTASIGLWYSPLEYYWIK